ncbi:ABC transporter ATP-binding protein/permease [Intestinimonas massiliensis]|mgnify:FL=1|uniref:ABC transporter ATP-binding protein/permease n=1 Tax=Intestinimonas massiliensis (ex Afouda et al. 2020) TaxID=1673721 RepID=A0ABS9M675_9FIRM|nr:ABC transporter ATP-binding protein [Intestinimonas massiliensis (ex Afouda et al. 2020)]MCG4526168.1 ABC transporter ATP-binding protein/permease [Intestinimonas massiliensis (ex Afouda et al. 2020)]MCQ4805891.1 ABC transporter ATP-binding protein/permease [Intestinimonas massiliensis (ex Afouda et al. 2020)]
MAYEEKEYAQSFDWRVWRGLMPFLRPYRKTIALVVVFNLLCALIDILLPLFQRYAIDHFIEKGTTEGMFGFGAAYFAAILLQALFVILFTRGSMRIEMYFGRDLKRACFVHLQTLSFSYYNVTPVGYIHSRVMSDTNRIATMTAWNLFDMLWSLAYVLGVFVAMLLLNVQLAMLIILVVPAIAALTWYFQNRILHWNRKVRKLNSKITGAFNEGITGAKTSKTLVIEEQNHRQFRELTEEMRASSVRAARLSAVYIPLVLFVSSAATAVVLARGGFLVGRDLLLLGTLSAFTSYAVGIFEPIQQFARNLADFISMQASMERVAGLLHEVPQVVDAPQVVEKYGDTFHPKRENWETIRGEITFEDVSFRYPDGDEDVLSHFSLHIPAGATVAIVGETGAGKSTLVNLACRFFEPTEGRILIDGVDYRERSQLWLHSSIGYVLQSPHLFSGTVMENIRYGRLEASEQEVRRAAEAVSADTVVNKLEQGYDSPVGEGGDRLSTGEKQLISFARAVLADPRIFVLDEATSSIDTETEQLIQNAIARLLEGRTSFLIAHRLSTIRHADVILVVKDGRIVEQGRHEELLRRQGYYHTLYSRQFAEEAALRLLENGK